MAAAIEVAGISKSFRIPHEQRTFLKEYFLHPFRRPTYERNDALTDVTFAVEQGEFFGVIGANGGGKSTLLRILAGIYVPDSGVVQVRGLLSPFIELGVGFNLELTARDNIRMVLSRDAVAARSRISGWRAAGRLPRRIVPPDALDEELGFLQGLRSRWAVR